MKISSYQASNGDVYSVGSTITIGPKSDRLYHNITPMFLDLNGEWAEVKKIFVSKSKKQGLFVSMLLSINTGSKLQIFPQITDIERALSIGEIVSNGDSIVTTKSKDMASTVMSDIQQYTLPSGTELFINKTMIEIQCTTEKKYKHLSCDTQIGGTVAKLIAIKAQGSSARLVLQMPNGELVTVFDAQKALDLGEIYVVK